MANGFLRDVITTFRERHTDVPIDATDEDSPEHVSFVQRGLLDVAFVLMVPYSRMHVEQFWMERVFVAVPDWRTLCAKDAIEWSMLRGEELIVCQSDRTRLTWALAPHRPNLRPRRPLSCFAHSQDSVEETRR
jgi:hypothetical protein